MTADQCPLLLFQGQAPVLEGPAARIPPGYHPPPPYTPLENRTSPAPPSESNSRQSLASRHSFREEVPSSSSSYPGLAAVGRLWSRSTGTPETERLGDMFSFNEEEPSFLQGPLRPPSYYEATSQSDGIPGLGNMVHHIWSTTQDGVLDTAAVTDSSPHGKQISPLPQYSVQPEVVSELPVRSILPEPEVPANAGRQPIAHVRPGINASQRLEISQEDAQRFENRVRQLQLERAMERRETAVDGIQRNVGDTRRSQQVAPAARIGFQRSRSNSTESRTSQLSVQSSQDDEEPVDNDPCIELVR